VITGTGMVTPLGNNSAECWDALLAGRSGIDYITKFDASHFKTKVAGEIKWLNRADLTHRYGDSVIERVVEYGHLLSATDEALQDAGLTPYGDEQLIIASGGINKLDLADYVRVLKEHLPTGDFQRLFSLLRKNYPDYFRLSKESQAPAPFLASLLGLNSPPKDIHVACAGGAQVVAYGYDLIKLGLASRVICSSVQAFDFTKFVSFTLLDAMSTLNDPPHKACRPFDKRRDGLIMSEGSASVILEDLDSALMREAPNIYGEVAGYGVTTDAYRSTDPHPEATHSAQAMVMALEDVGCRPGDIDYINAHGTSTQANDMLETKAIKKVFGQRAYNIPINATKSMTGHMLVSAGLVETIVTAFSLQTGRLHPTLHLEESDPECDLNYLPGTQSLEVPIKTAMTNSFGFGGHNVSLILKKFC